MISFDLGGVKVVVGEGQPGCRTNAVDCSRCLSGSGRVAVGGGIGGGGGGGEKLQQQEPVCWRPAARRCRSRATSGWSRMLNPANDSTRPTPPKSLGSGWVVVETEVKLGQSSIFGGCWIGLPAMCLLY